KDGVGEGEGGEGHPEVGHAVQAEGFTDRFFGDADTGPVEVGNHRQRTGEGEDAIANVSRPDGGWRGEIAVHGLRRSRGQGAYRNTVRTRRGGGKGQTPPTHTKT